MVEFRWIQISFLLTRVLQITAAVPGPFTLSFRDGAEVNLTCANVTDDSCGSTTWLFSSFLHTTTLFEYGQIHKDISSGSRLSVTEKCSLVIKKVTTTDAGQYTCRHFRSGQNISETSVILFVVSGKETGEDATAATTEPPTKRTMGKNWWWCVFVFVGLAAVLMIVAAVVRWRRTKANEKGMDDNVADPEDGIRYASISYMRKTNSKARIQGDDDDDDGDAVTYSTVNASSCSARGSADPSSLYSTVNKPD
ncbi:uncharacterized protein LOC115574582 [Sparus aurata]|uniref:uncharacterized protein LOC115574582 n=1 Tax=Sparus aurata TaxID=8175 RepID=UPI0011C1C574|nr:uncharacterized protein LOC115574582 [Sparus aurata]